MILMYIYMDLCVRVYVCIFQGNAYTQMYVLCVCIVTEILNEVGQNNMRYMRGVNEMSEMRQRQSQRQIETGRKRTERFLSLCRKILRGKRIRSASALATHLGKCLLVYRP